MEQFTVLRLTSLVLLIIVTSSAKEQTRWSRQISSYTSDIGDWVPLSAPVERDSPLPPIKRQAVAEPRILSEPFPGLPRPSGFSSDAFSSRKYINTPGNRQLYLQSVPSVPSAPQNYLTDQGFGHSIRFGLSQPNFPLNQGFISPQLGFDSVHQSIPHVVNQGLPHTIPQTMPQNIPQTIHQTLPQIKQNSQFAPSNPIKFEDFRKIPMQMSVPLKHYSTQTQKIKPEIPKFIDGYRAENTSNDFAFPQKKKLQSLQKIYDKPAPQIPQNIAKPQQSNQKVEREEVQLLYVPLDSLNRGQFDFRSPLSASHLQNPESYSQRAPQTNNKKSVIELQRPAHEVEIPSPQNYFTDFNSRLHSTQQKEIDQVPKFSTLSSPFPMSPPTTPKPKKLKPHQPPLAIFLTEDTRRNNQIKVGDVLNSLKSANSVAVLDSVNPLNAPKVFIGPSSLQPLEHYVKFELPYLSNIENSDKKLRQLPFFVAPLSYNTPQGFAKIPFPSPHVGSVVINSQIRETSSQELSTENYKPNYYTATYNKQEQQKLPQPITQKPSISFFSTAAPKTKLPSDYQTNYYQFEPQTVSTLRPLKEPEAVAPPRPGNYFLHNAAPQYNSQNYNTQYDRNKYELPAQNIYQAQLASTNTYTSPQPETTTTPRTTVTTTTRPPSTYPSQLLETHNPYSINQAFHFSTPLDYRTYVDEYKDPNATPITSDPASTPQKPLSTTSTTTKAAEPVTEHHRYKQPTSPHYQSYTPEIHYESEIQNSRYPVYNTNDYNIKTETAESYSPVQSGSTDYNPPASNPVEYTENQEIQVPVQSETPIDEQNKLPTVSDIEIPQRYEYNLYETNFDSKEGQTSSTTTTTTTTSTTRRVPIRNRGRPRYTTTPRSEFSEYSTRAVTRKPLRERRPLPTRPRYEPNKITSEKPTRKPVDYSEESTTKSSRTRQRGRVTYKPTEETYDRRKSHNGKEKDLAYQRDVLHQNYPVTIQERMSTVDIEAMTEPTLRLTSTKDIEPATETIDTENAYTYERATISEQNANPESNEDIPIFPTRTTVDQTETSYVPRLSTRDEEYAYYSRSSAAPAPETIAYEDTHTEKGEESISKQTTVQKELESVVYETEPTSSINEQKEHTYTENEDTYREEETTTTTPEVEVTQALSQESEEENVVQTTPSYNRVRVRPGVIKQYHQASTESSKVKIDRRRPVTYRPAFDRRRTTMRIDEIQQDLKTKQVNGRPDGDDYRHPVYKPESSTEPSSTHEASTKRGAFRRRRPNYSYTTSTTEGSSPYRKNTYEAKNRFRGRRPTTEKSIEKTEVVTEASTTSVRPLYSRYSLRPRLSERYNKKPEPEEAEDTEDQDPNYSINRPRFTEPDVKQWSPEIASDSFKPYNPNNIVDDEKVATTERRSDNIEMDIITAKNDVHDYDDVLISVTPASNNRNNKKIPDIPPTLEALVEQSKVTKSDANDKMSTFESMLEEVMKSLEEQDENEYSSNVMKHKGGEIGEIPPERIITSDDSYAKATSPLTQEVTTVEPTATDDSTTKEAETRKTRRRGVWKKKVKVRPIATESIEVAESQYYPSTVNRLGQPMKPSKSVIDKSNKKITVTTYKPSLLFLQNIFSGDDSTANDEVIPIMEISKVTAVENKEKEETHTTVVEKETQTELNVSPGDYDLGTGSPDPTIDDLYNTPTAPTTVKSESSGFSFIDYLFGTTSEDNLKADLKNETTTEIQIDITTAAPKPNLPTTETSFMPEEITELVQEEIATDIKKIVSSSTAKIEEVTSTEAPKVETSSQSTFMNPANVVSTSMSTEISHETEICFRGKCIKTFKDVLHN